MRIFGILGLALTVAVPAAATLPPGVVAVHDFGRCIAPRAQRLATKLLATQPVSKAERDAYRHLTDNGEPCLTFGTLGQPMVLLRGAVAEGLLSGPLAGAAMHPAPATPVLTTVDSSVAEDYRRSNEDSYGFARCVAMAQPSGVRTLIAAIPDSAEERAAFDGLKPALDPCHTGVQGMRLDRPTLRALLAEGLYMLTVVSR